MKYAVIFYLFFHCLSVRGEAPDYQYNTSSQRCEDARGNPGQHFGKIGKCGALSRPHLSFLQRIKLRYTRNLQGMVFNIEPFTIKYGRLNFKKSDLSGARLSYVEVDGGKIQNGQIDQIKFDHSFIKRQIWSQVIGTRPIFFQSVLYALDIENSEFDSGDFIESKITAVNIRSSILKHSFFQNSQIRNTRIINTDLTGSNFEKAQLHTVNLSGSNLKHVGFEKAHLDFVNFRDANLQGANFIDAKTVMLDLRGADLSDVKISHNTSFLFARYDSKTILPFDEEEARFEYQMVNCNKQYCE